MTEIISVVILVVMESIINGWISPLLVPSGGVVILVVMESIINF